MRPRRATPPCSACWRLPPRSTRRLRRRPTAPPLLLLTRMREETAFARRVLLSWRRARGLDAHMGLLQFESLKPVTPVSRKHVTDRNSTSQGPNVREVPAASADTPGKDRGPREAPWPHVSPLSCSCSFDRPAPPQQQDDRGKILLTIFLATTVQDASGDPRPIGADRLMGASIRGVEVVSWYVMMGIGQVVTVRLPAERLREVTGSSRRKPGAPTAPTSTRPTTTRPSPSRSTEAREVERRRCSRLS